MLLGLGLVPIAGAVALGIVGGIVSALWILPFVAFGGFIVIAYNLGLWGDRFHSDFWFAFAWGAFPAMTSYWVNSPKVTLSIVLLAVACFLISLVQRTLSTPVRSIRRRTLAVEGSLRMADGSIVALDSSTIVSAPEKALLMMSVAMVVLAGGLLAFRL